MIVRIKKVIQIKKLTSSAFADKIGVPRSTISHILSGRNNPSLEFVQKVLDTFPEIRTEWLIRGEGYMVKSINTLFPDEDSEEPENLLDSDIKEIQTTQAKLAKDMDDSLKEARTIHAPEKKKVDASKTQVTGPAQEQKIFSGQNTDTEDKRTVPVGELPKKAIRVLLFYNDGTFTEYYADAQ